ncbi:MAG: septal ring lytic transglycosylase RlpA family protein [Deltaproteobacteria bacterium]|jgi:rare lipoprotein A|nr:septal ring lytic transglycosylase RlpA family protein [Deltaproteobacteria bacterium]
MISAHARPGLALFFAALTCCALFLSGCALFRSADESTAPVSGKRGTKPYTVRGKTYYPLSSANGYREEGVASWYGKDFHGKTTANGERYDMYGATAAHKILPFGTKVKVTNTRNGRSIVVRINDRGPFVANRIIDLTNTGAKALDMLASGTAPVILEAVGSVKGLSRGNLSGVFYIQTGAFGSRQNADRLVSSLKAQGLAARTFFSPAVNLWRVQAGPYRSLRQAEKAALSLDDEFPGNFVMAE